MTVTERRLMVPVCLSVGKKHVLMDWERRLVVEFDNWRADRQVFNRGKAIRMMIRWAAAHDTTGRQRPVRPSDPILEQLDAFKDAQLLLARTEAVKLAVLTVLRQPWPVGNARDLVVRSHHRKRPLVAAPPTLVVDNR